MFKFNTIEEAIQDLKDGKIILVTDDEDRENEGDLICAAQFATTENVNFMATYAKGLICMPMSSANIHRLGIAPYGCSIIRIIMKLLLQSRLIMLILQQE